MIVQILEDLQLGSDRAQIDNNQMSQRGKKQMIAKELKVEDWYPIKQWSVAY